MPARAFLIANFSLFGRNLGEKKRRFLTWENFQLMRLYFSAKFFRDVNSMSLGFNRKKASSNFHYAKFRSSVAEPFARNRPPVQISFFSFGFSFRNFRRFRCFSRNLKSASFSVPFCFPPVITIIFVFTFICCFKFLFRF